MPTYTGSCYCNSVQYEININSTDEARTSVCHCRNCRKFTGCPFGTTTKVPPGSLQFKEDRTLKTHISDNGGSTLTRQFCGECGSGIAEWGESAGETRYVFYGTLGEEGQRDLGCKGEFFCSQRRDWLPEIPNVFHKQEIKQ